MKIEKNSITDLDMQQLCDVWNKDVRFKYKRHNQSDRKKRKRIKWNPVMNPVYKVCGWRCRYNIFHKNDSKIYFKKTVTSMQQLHWFNDIAMVSD